MTSKTLSGNVRDAPKAGSGLAECVREKILEGLPFITGIRGGRIQLSLSRMLFRFRDWYTPNVKVEDDRIVLELKGDRSSIVLAAPPDGSSVSSQYKGPRGWILRKHLPTLESAFQSLLQECRKSMEERSATAIDSTMEGADYSRHLARVSFVSRIVLKSLMLANDEVIVRKGGLLSVLEDYIKEYGTKYRLLYISGTGPATFRLLFVDGKPVGAFVHTDGRDYYGVEADDKINEIEGLVRIKVYGSLEPPEEVLVA
ncbi:MAG: hypothetical protein LRS48_03315 [Desulfurococcales archaeon]|nr:hypothetical protein [Desulfurococcales archaeon]